MKVSGGGFDFSAAPALLPVAQVSVAVSAQSKSQATDGTDSPDFGSLLSKGHSDDGSASRSVKPVTRDAQPVKRAASASPKEAAGSVSPKGSLGKRADASNDRSNLKGSDLSVSSLAPASGVSQASDSPELPSKSEDAAESLLSGLPELPPDPRLADPSELAMEAVAVAALAAASSAQAPSPDQSLVPTGSDDSSSDPQISDQGQGAGSQSRLFDPLAQIATRATSSLPRVPSQAPLENSAPPIAAPLSDPGASAILSSSGVAPERSLSAANQTVLVSSGQAPLPALAPVVDDAPMVEAPLLPASPQIASLESGGAQAPESVNVPISSPLISLTATSAEVAALVAASSQKISAQRAAAHDKDAVPAALSVKSAVDVRAAVLAAQVVAGSVLQTKDDVQKQGSLTVVPALPEEPVLPSQSSSASTPALASEDHSAKASLAEDGTGGQNASGSGLGEDSDAGKPAGHIKTAEVPHRVMGKAPEAELKFGTRDANVAVVPKEETSSRIPAIAESLSASLEEAPQSSSLVDRTDSNQSAVGSPFVGVNRPPVEVVSKPTVLPPVQVRVNEAWKVVQDAIQRARSENPSHLAVEVRMDDGSTLGVELRMSGAGLQASFRSESQTLLRSIESQWTAFVSKEPADARVTSAVFENRSSFGGSMDFGTSGGERRQQMEDASTAASLSRSSQVGVASQTSSVKDSSPAQVQNGRISAYA